ncbi:Probable G-protein coupled receptor Mth-like 1 [Eumeta japonica]|uniref:Probable G-protein coupled receptor Mth-like 1 n=1 Tax=Eumeta variegata TaxID=151549 RepID=A0A4C1ZUB0_EUMVA|nr:Probable G-protein coupled receptor Mth-like 1 [Eumeta japonica]
MGRAAGAGRRGRARRPPGRARRVAPALRQATLLVLRRRRDPVLLRPVGVLLCVNLALFVSTTRQLTWLWRRATISSRRRSARRWVACARRGGDGRHVGRRRCRGRSAGPSTWYVTDLLNALQGVFIFIVVGCQPQVSASSRRSRCRVRARVAV